MSTMEEIAPQEGTTACTQLLQHTAHVNSRPSKAAEPSPLYFLTLSHMLQKQPTCMPGRSMKFRSALSSPRHSTGTRLAFCCMASLTKPACSTRSPHAAVMLPKQMWHLCRQRNVLPYIPTVTIEGPAVISSYTALFMLMGGSTFMVGVDDKLFLAAEAASVHKLSLPARHQDDRSALI